MRPWEYSSDQADKAPAHRFHRNQIIKHTNVIRNIISETGIMQTERKSDNWIGKDWSRGSRYFKKSD